MARHAEVLEELLARAALRGERAVAVTRLVICALFVVLWLLRQRYAGGITGWTVLGSYMVGAAYSVWVLRWLVASEVLKRHLYLSVAVDALIISVVLIPGALWPGVRYTGFLGQIDFAILVLAAVASGVRLSRGVALFGSGLMIAVFAILQVIDLTSNAAVVNYGGLYMLSGCVYMAGAVVLAVAVSGRTRGLVMEGASAAVEAERARQHLGIYVSEEVAEAALRETSLSVGGQRQSVSVIFSDLRGFTRYSEKRPPEAIVAELNAYLDAMVKVIKQHGGLVDKFIGDAIMAVFGAHESRPDDAARAIKTAAAMQRALEEHNLRREARGRPVFQHGIAVHHGEVVAGNIGNRDRLQFTVIGQNVNLASRMEAATKTTGEPVLISAAALEAARACDEQELPPVRRVGTITVPDQEVPVEVYTLDLPDSSA